MRAKRNVVATKNNMSQKGKETRESVGEAIRKYRIDKDLSQKLVAQYINEELNKARTSKDISAWEKGDTPVYPEDIRCICEILNITPNDLFRGAGF